MSDQITHIVRDDTRSVTGHGGLFAAVTVNSLVNKTDELSALVKNVRIYRESSLLCFFESWLTASISDANVNLPGFTTFRADRDTKASGKRKGGGLVLFTNNRWCNPGHVTVKTIICSKDIELLAVSLRPYYMPREFSHAIAVCVYIPPRAHAEAACDVIHSTVSGLQTQHPDAFVFISGDFNHVTLDSCLPAFSQFVDCPTRGDRTIDLLYANVRDAYKATSLPPLGKSDHNLVLLQPKYKPKVKRLPVTTRSFRKWSPEAEAALRGCFESTDWGVLQDTWGEDIEKITECTTDYINFCMEVAVPSRTVRCFPNNKPWITSDIKALLNEKKRAFRDRDKERLKQVQAELRVRLKEAKDSYRRKVEQKLQQNNMREAWDGMKIITGCSSKRGGAVEGDADRANQLNLFFNRFNSAATPTTTTTMAPSPKINNNSKRASKSSPSPPAHLTLTNPALPVMNNITAAQVSNQLRKICASKAAGPDGVSPRLLKTCAAELGEPLQRIFNLSLRLGSVPSQWKTSCIVPIPKKPRPKELSDYRPVALTSHVMKTMERLLLHQLRPQVSHALDPLQFGYRERVGVDDAILYLLHRALSHLDKGNSAVRIMFFDFSSAFNTIQPRLLGDKLTDMGVDLHLVTWITDYLTGRPQYVRLRNTTSDTVICSTGAPQGTVLSPVLFTLYTSDFQYNTEQCHMQKFSDDTAVVGCIRDGREEEYRQLIQDFVVWCRANNLQLNTSKTKEMVVDFRRRKPQLLPITIEGDIVEWVETYKYLGLHLDHKLDWTVNCDTLYKKTQSRMYFLRRLRSFNICQKLLQIFYQSVVASALFYAVVCWGGQIKKGDKARLDKLVKKAGSVVGIELEPLTSVAERRVLSRLLSILDNPHHPLHSTFSRQRSSFSDRLLSLSCSTDRLRKSFVPQAVRLYNASL